MANTPFSKWRHRRRHIALRVKIEKKCSENDYKWFLLGDYLLKLPLVRPIVGIIQSVHPFWYSLLELHFFEFMCTVPSVSHLALMLTPGLNQAVYQTKWTNITCIETILKAWSKKRVKLFWKPIWSILRCQPIPPQIWRIILPSCNIIAHFCCLVHFFLYTAYFNLDVFLSDSLVL